MFLGKVGGRWLRMFQAQEWWNRFCLEENNYHVKGMASGKLLTRNWLELDLDFQIKVMS